MKVGELETLAAIARQRLVSGDGPWGHERLLSIRVQVADFDVRLVQKPFHDGHRYIEDGVRAGVGEKIFCSSNDLPHANIILSSSLQETSGKNSGNAFRDYLRTIFVCHLNF